MTQENFERVEGHQFRAGEKIFMIDIDNNYDIWEAEIVSVRDNDQYEIHYPEYPDDDQIIDGTSHLLARTERNKRIFDEQEKIRLEHEKENSGESEGDDDFEDKPKKKKQNKNKPKKEKKVKVPKPKKVKEPKPKKEKEPKPKKVSRHKISDKELASLKKKIVLEAIKKKIKDADAFIKFFDDTYRKIYLDKQMDLIFDKTLKRFENLLKKAEEQGREDMVVEDDDYDEQQMEEEEAKELEPETISLPDVPKKLNEGYEVLVANTVLSFDKESPFPILFDEQGKCNCFIYKTTDKQYLILNGMKFELEPKVESEQKIDHNQNAESDGNGKKATHFLYESAKLKARKNMQNSEYLYPTLIKSGHLKLKEPKESLEYVANITKKKVRMFSNIPEQPTAEKISKHKGSHRRDTDQSRVLPDFLEESD